MSNLVPLAVNAVRQRHGIDPWPPGYAEALDARINAAIAAVDSSSKPAILAAALLLKSIVREAERGFAEERRGRGATFQR